jgi:hypothetical protein
LFGVRFNYDFISWGDNDSENPESPCEWITNLDLALPKTLVNSRSSSGRFAQDFGHKASMSTANSPSIHLVFAPKGGRRVLSSATIDEGGPSPRKLNVNRDTWKPSFRGICILMLLAKYQGKKAADKEDNTWIYTLAGTRPTEQDDWFKTTFGVKRFIFASRGSFPKGSLFPYAHYLTNILPPENVYFYDGSLNHPICDEDLVTHATGLETGYWTQETVPILLGRKPDLNIESAPTPASFYKETKLEWNINQLLYHYNSCKDEYGKCKDVAKRDRIVEETKNLYAASFLLYEVARKHIDLSEEEKHPAVQVLEDHKKYFPLLCNQPLTRYGENVLIIAIAGRIYPAIDFLLNLEEIDVNVKTTKGITPLLKAAMINDVDLVKRLVKKGADLEAVSSQGANGIYEAAFGATRNALQTIKYFTQCGLGCGVSCADGSTPLSVALLRRCPENAIQFLAANSRVGKLKKVGKLRMSPEIQNENSGGILSGRDSDPFPLLTAASNGDVAEIRPLLARGKAKVNDVEPVFGNTALHKAVENGHYEVVLSLLHCGADPFCQNIHGRIPRDLIPVNRNSDSQINDKKEPGSFAEIEDQLRMYETGQMMDDWRWAGHKEDALFKASFI